MPEKVTSFYICPWSLLDPLCQSQSLSYINQLTAEGHSFALLTLENGKFLPTNEKLREIQGELREKNIFWYPIRWQSGNSIFDKISSIFKVVASGIKVCRKHRPEIIHSRSSLTTFLGLTLSKLFRTTYLYDADSILSEEYADTNHLSRESLGFKVLAGSEASARRNAARIIVLTEKLKNDYRQNFKVEKPIDVIPCCVDTNKFDFDPEARKKRRAELGLTDEMLFVYVGKVGSWYMVDEMLDFFRVVLAEDKLAKMLVVTNDKAEVFTSLFASNNLAADSYFIRRAPHGEVAEWLSAADVGIAFIKPLPSKRGSSPVKTSEYLACGLPVISNRGIGDLDTVIETTGTGVILQKFDEENYRRAFKESVRLLHNENLRNICRKTACQYFDLEKVGGAKYRRLYQQLLSRR